MCECTSEKTLSQMTYLGFCWSSGTTVRWVCVTMYTRPLFLLGLFGSSLFLSSFQAIQQLSKEHTLKVRECKRRKLASDAAADAYKKLGLVVKSLGNDQ